MANPGEPNPSQYYFLLSESCRLWLDLDNGSKDNGAKIQGWAGFAASQMWRFKFMQTVNNTKYYQVFNYASQTVIDGGGGHDNGHTVHGWEAVGLDHPAVGNQLWALELHANNGPAPDTYVIRSKLSGTVLDLSDGDKWGDAASGLRNGLKVQGWAWTSSVNQQWYLIPATNFRA